MADCSRELDLAYAAGFIDADGCITIQSKKDLRFGQPSLSVSQVSIEPLLVLRNIFGGSISKHDDNRKETYAPSFRWRLVSRKAIGACQELLPYLRYKRRQAELLLDWDKTTLSPSEKWYGLSINALQTRRAISNEFLFLNRKGVKRGVLTLEAVQGRV